MTLFRSIFIQLFAPYLFGTTILTFVLSMDTIYKLINLIVSKGVNVQSVGLMLLYRIPQFLSVTMPLGVVIATTLVMIRLSSDLEITAMRANGIGYDSLAKPILAFGLLSTGLTLLNTLFVNPAGFAAFEEEQVRMLKSHTVKNIQPGVLNFDFADKVLYTRDKEDDVLKGVFIADRKLEAESYVIASEEGKIIFKETQELLLQLHKGSLHQTLAENEGYRITSFDTLDYIFKLPEIASPQTGHVWGLSTWELWGSNKYKESLELALRVTTPWACLGFAMAAISLSLVNPRSGRSGAYLRALIIVVVYYILWLGMKELTFREKMTPQLLWIPPSVIFLFGVYNLYKHDHNHTNLFEVVRSFFSKPLHSH